MKPGILTNRWVVASMAILVTLGLISWQIRQEQPLDTQSGKFQITDTVPKQKEKKIRNLDEALEELDDVKFDFDFDKIRVEIAEAMKNIDMQKIQMDVQKAMQDVNFDKIRLDIEKSIASIDMDKLRKEIEAIDFSEMRKGLEELKKVDMDKIKMELDASMAELKKIDMTELKVEMDKLKEEMKELGPKLEKELANAKVEIEKAKVEIREYKEFIDGLEKDGLLNKKQDYTIEHKNGELTVNGKKVSPDIYNKYRTFLEKHKKFSIEKDDDDFDIDND